MTNPPNGKPDRDQPGQPVPIDPPADLEPGDDDEDIAIELPLEPGDPDGQPF